MNLTITFKKHKSKRNTLSCTRPDGSETWAKIHPGLAIHDLIHYTVETTLNYKNAFYGLLAQGHNIEDFALPRAERPIELLPKNLPFEATYTEFVVGLFQMEVVTYQPYENFNSILKDIFEEKKLSNYQAIPPTSISIIRSKIADLYQQWKVLANGEKLTLIF